MKKLTNKLVQVKQWILSFVINSSCKEKHIWKRKGIERKCIRCGKEQYNLVNVINGKGEKHGCLFYLRDKWM